MFRKRIFWIALTVMVVIGAVSYALASGFFEGEQAGAEEAPLQSTVARQGNITISASGAGTIIPAKEINLVFQQNGLLAELLVQVGDRVQAGDVLARLDDSDAQQALANTQLQVDQAAIRTDPESTQTGTSLNAISEEQAELNLDEAQKALDDLLNWEPDEDEIAQAELNLAAAQAALETASNQQAAGGNSIVVSKINVDQAQRDLEDAQEAYDAAYDPGRDWELNDPRRAPRLEAERESTADRLQRAEENLTVAQANYNSTYLNNTGQGGMINAQSSLLNAQLARETALNGPTDEQIEAAQMAVRRAELSLLQAQLGQETDAISLAQARLNLAAAEEALEQTELVAPMDGTVMSIAADVGEMAGTSPFIVLADLEQPVLEVFLDETDLDKVGLNFEVEITFDALPDELFTGRVVQVDPQLSQVSGVSAVRALVQLDAESFAKPQTLPVGLNATVEVIGGRAQGATLVPVEALRELSPGEYAVFVMEDGEPKLRLVEVGLMDFTFAEILSGVEPGETVTTGVLETD